MTHMPKLAWYATRKLYDKAAKFSTQVGCPRNKNRSFVMTAEEAYRAGQILIEEGYLILGIIEKNRDYRLYKGGIASFRIGLGDVDFMLSNETEKGLVRMAKSLKLPTLKASRTH